MTCLKILKDHWPIVLIIALAAIIRFWRIEALTTFGGDQGYDFLIVKRMIQDGKFTLLGPKLGPYSDIANVYLGPAYYYLIAPSLFLWRLDPLGPSVFMVTLSLLTILIIYLTGIKFMSKQVAIVSSLIYSVNPYLVEQSRVALNPFPAPFFSALVIYSAFKIIVDKAKSLTWPLIIGFSIGIMFQLHYLNVAIIPPVVLVFAIYKKLKKLVYLLIAFAVAISPQIFFEVRHNFFITNQIVKRITEGDDISSGKLIVQQIVNSAQLLFSSLLLTDKIIILTFCILSIAILSLLINKKERTKSLLFTLIIFFSILFASMYSKTLQLHYFASAYVSLTLLLAGIFIWVFNRAGNSIIKAILTLILIAFLALNFAKIDFTRKEGYTMPSGWNLPGIKKASNIIASDINTNKSFNVAATLDGDTRARPYRYLLESQNKIPLDVEHYPEADVLYLISRDDEDKIKAYTVWEVASFAPFNIKNLREVQNGVKVYKLTKQ